MTLVKILQQTGDHRVGEEVWLIDDTQAQALTDAGAAEILDTTTPSADAAKRARVPADKQLRPDTLVTK